MKLKSSRGFTLIEVLVAMLILAGTSIVLYQSWAGSLNAVKKGRLYNTISLLLQKKVVDFEVESKGKKVDELKDEESGDFGDDYPDFTWDIKLQPFKIPPIVPPGLGDNGGGGNGGNQNQLAETILKTMSDYFEKAVREVQITVSYKRGERTFKYSVSTIYVDYSVEIPSGV